MRSEGGSILLSATDLMRFQGCQHATRLDLAALRQLSGAMAQGSIVLFGPLENPDPELFGIGRVHVRPPVAFDRLPAIAASSHLLIMPYVNQRATRSLEWRRRLAHRPVAVE